MDLSMNKEALYDKAYEKWGILQFIVGIEEMSELQKELCKFIRVLHSDYEDSDIPMKMCRTYIAEETADVEIMLEQIKRHLNIGDQVEAVKAQKLERLANRLETGSFKVYSEGERPIGYLGLSVKLTNILRRKGIKTIGQLKFMSDDHLYRINGIGRTSVHQIRKALNEYLEGVNNVSSDN